MHYGLFNAEIYFSLFICFTAYQRIWGYLMPKFISVCLFVLRHIQFVYLFYGISMHYGLFNAGIYFS